MGLAPAHSTQKDFLVFQWLAVGSGNLCSLVGFGSCWSISIKLYKSIINLTNLIKWFRLFHPRLLIYVKLLLWNKIIRTSGSISISMLRQKLKLLLSFNFGSTCKNAPKLTITSKKSFFEVCLCIYMPLSMLFYVIKTKIKYIIHLDIYIYIHMREICLYFWWWTKPRFPFWMFRKIHFLTQEKIYFC